MDGAEAELGVGGSDDDPVATPGAAGVPGAFGAGEPAPA